MPPRRPKGPEIPAGRPGARWQSFCYSASTRTILAIAAPAALPLQASAIKWPNLISRVSEQSSLRGRHKEYSARNLIELRSNTNSSLIVVTSASTPFSTDSRAFSLNFLVASMIAARVQSNIGGIKGEAFTRNCLFATLDSGMGDDPGLPA